VNTLHISHQEIPDIVHRSTAPRCCKGARRCRARIGTMIALRGCLRQSKRMLPHQTDVADDTAVGPTARAIVAQFLQSFLINAEKQ